MGAKYLSHLIARIEATAMAKAIWRGLLTKSFTSMLQTSVPKVPKRQQISRPPKLSSIPQERILKVTSVMWGRGSIPGCGGDC
jgi:hypothetical protein